MSIHAKICGLRNREDALLAAEHGAGMLGFVHFPPSPRHIDPEDVGLIAKAVRGQHAVPIVAVTVNPSDEAIGEIMAAYQPDFLQLHGEEDAARIRAIQKRFGVKIIKAIAVADGADMAVAATFLPVADRIMLDAKPPKDAALPGGNGVTFDWSLPKSYPIDTTNWLLSGGLTPENLAQAVGESGAGSVDVSSGVEYQPGMKSPEKIIAFLNACLAF